MYAAKVSALIRRLIYITSIKKIEIEITQFLCIFALVYFIVYTALASAPRNFHVPL